MKKIKRPKSEGKNTGVIISIIIVLAVILYFLVNGWGITGRVTVGEGSFDRDDVPITGDVTFSEVLNNFFGRTSSDDDLDNQAGSGGQDSGTGGGYGSLAGPEYYVRAGATGTGTDWNNAFGSLPSTLVRGAIYYIASGDYVAYSFNSATGTSTDFVTVKKATESDHGTNTGWNSAYGIGTAKFNGRMGLTISYLTIDGGKGGGPGNWDGENEEFGITVTQSNVCCSYFVKECTGPNQAGSIIGMYDGVSHINLHHMRVTSPTASTSNPGGAKDITGILFNQGSDYITITFVSLGPVFNSALYMGMSDHVLISNIYVHHVFSTNDEYGQCPFVHGAGMTGNGKSTDVTVANSLF